MPMQYHYQVCVSASISILKVMSHVFLLDTTNYCCSLAHAAQLEQQKNRQTRQLQAEPAHTMKVKVEQRTDILEEKMTLHDI